MSLTEAEVQHVAVLARLGLTDAEVERFRGQLAAVLAHMATLAELAEQSVPPSASTTTLANVMRPDEVWESMPVATVLANAPRAEDDHFRVPPVFEQEGEDETRGR